MKSGYYSYLLLSDGSEFSGKMTFVIENQTAKVYGKSITGPSKLLVQALEGRFKMLVDLTKPIVTTTPLLLVTFYVGLSQIVFAAPQS